MISITIAWNFKHVSACLRVTTTHLLNYYTYKYIHIYNCTCTCIQVYTSTTVYNTTVHTSTHRECSVRKQAHKPVKLVSGCKIPNVATLHKTC